MAQDAKTNAKAQSIAAMRKVSDCIVNRSKDYESRHPKKTIRISRGYSASLSVCELLCD